MTLAGSDMARRLPVMPAAADLATLLQRALLAQLVEHFHGKEGVIGSSPMEGLLGRIELREHVRVVLRRWSVWLVLPGRGVDPVMSVGGGARRPPPVVTPTPPWHSVKPTCPAAVARSP